MKYLEGNIFVNFYIFGVAGILAVLFGGVIFAKMGLRQSYMISFIACMIGCIGMLII
jgi:MFS family permease|tara:strand:+ start:1273 stop:1443 length:171 start_codon:yes stop_codon:yes gene_type:complete